MTKAEELLRSLDDLTWESYVPISEAISYIDESNIEGELAEASTRYTYWSGMQALAKRKFEEAKIELDQHAAIMSKEAREEADARVSGKKPTDKKIMALVESSALYKGYRMKVSDAEFKYNLMRNLTEALKQRKDMLVQLSANSRKETDLYS